MTRKDIEATLLPGDCLLYRPCSFYGRLIARRTWHNICHCEMYVGKGQSFASRDGVGVGQYSWRHTELAYVLRPVKQDLHWTEFWRWYRIVNGQGYDWWGLLRFVLLRWPDKGDNGKQFCSEALTRAYRKLEAGVISDLEDADAVAPFEFLLSPNLTVIATEQSLR